MKTEYEKKLNKLYRIAYQRSVSAFDGLLDPKLLKSFAKLKNTGIRLSAIDDKSAIPFMHFFLDSKRSKKLFEDVTKDMPLYRVWKKLYTQYEIDRMEDSESKKWAQESLNKWEEYKKEMEGIPVEDCEQISEELLSGKYKEYTRERNVEVETLSFNYYMGPTPNTSYEGFCKNKEEFLKLLRENAQDNFNFKNTYTLDDVKQLCEKSEVRYSQDLGVAILWFANITNERQLYKDERSKLTYYRNY